MRQLACLVSLLVAAAAAHAQGTSSSSSSSSSTSSSTSTSAGGASTASAASSICGGVGRDDQERIRSEASRRGVLLQFATPSGNFIADVQVTISSADGRTVLQANCDAPLMLVDLSPKGSYQVTATARGHSQRRTVTVGDRPTSVAFVFPFS